MNKITELLHITYPIIQGGMANISTGAFAAAVSNAGGLGIIASGGKNVDQLKAEIVSCRSLTDKPFGVNLMLMNPFIDALAQLMVDEKIKIVTTGAGNPAKYIPLFKEHNILIMPVVPSSGLAKRMEGLGVDAVIAEGSESGGHIGELTTMALIPQVVEAVSIPIIAAGGIASGQQLAAALALGADGVQIGTCLLVAEECPIHINYKNAVLKAKDIDSVVTGRICGAPVRCLKNEMTKTYIALEKKGATVMELEELTLGSMRKAVLDGDVVHGSVMAGQVAGMCHEILPIRVIIENLVRSAQRVIHELPTRELL